ncbi:MAG: hypothetical protein RR704_00875 [Stenotrophomonas sp.]
MNAYDIAREERIEALSRLLSAAQEAGDRDEMRRIYEEFRAAVLARSPDQMALLEHQMFVRIAEANHGR